jgi:thiamine kinase-like enzyme
VSHALLGDERRLTREESRRILAAAAAMHAEFRGEAPAELATLEARLGASSPALADAERTGHDLVPKQLPAAWDAFERAFADDVTGPIRALVDDPAPLAERMRRSEWTLLHGDLRDDNLGLEGDTIYLLDWDLASCGPPAVDFAWYLMHDAWRIDASHDEVVADFLEAEGEAVDADDLALGLVAGLVMYGWLVGHSAVVHPDPAERAWAAEEIAWWEPRARAALARSGLLR